ncbi:MAG TPA: S1C family serine protease [candidate division Zixibacteria bacterium]|nr:S1C family serine protease [candidate division Zixibacteria bacterium]
MLTSVFDKARRPIPSILLAFFLAGAASAADSSLCSLESAITELVYNVSRSVVTVQASRPFYGDLTKGASDEAVEQFVFSGLVLDSGGHILAPASSVAGSESIVVNFEGIDYPARVLGTDYLNGVSLLDVGQGIGQPVEFSDQHGCAGQMIVAVGNSFGLRACPSIGFCAGIRPEGSLQFTAALNPGAVGGGLFDMSGRLVGAINDGLGDRDLLGVGLAVPARKIPEIAEYIVQNGDRASGYIGITTADIEITPGIELDVPQRFAATSATKRYHTIDKGTLITDVISGSPAAHAGLRSGDLIYSINGRVLTSALEMMNQIRKGKPGSTIELGVIRHNRPGQVPVVIGSRKDYTYTDRANTPSDKSVIDSLQNEVLRLKQSLQAIEDRLGRVRP